MCTTKRRFFVGPIQNVQITRHGRLWLQRTVQPTLRGSLALPFPLPLNEWTFRPFFPAHYTTICHNFPGFAGSSLTWSSWRFFVTSWVQFYYVCIAVLHNLVAGLLARSQYTEGPATGHLGKGFSWFPCVEKRMLRWFPRLQVATTCFSWSFPDLNFLDPYFIFMYMHNNHCHRATAHLQ